MREIKFRYKIKERKKLMYDTDEEFGYLQRKRELIAGSKGEMFIVEKEMQYTGLKDNTQWDMLSKDEQQNFMIKNGFVDEITAIEKWNGKKIYERDIVDYEIKAGTGKLAIGLVKWNQIICRFIVIDLIKKKMVANCEQIDKVMGNIYENKELLK